MITMVGATLFVHPLFGTDWALEVLALRCSVPKMIRTPYTLEGTTTRATRIKH